MLWERPFVLNSGSLPLAIPLRVTESGVSIAPGEAVARSISAEATDVHTASRVWRLRTIHGAPGHQAPAGVCMLFFVRILRNLRHQYSA